MSVVNSERYEIQLCADCAQWHANGELPHDADDERISEIVDAIGLTDDDGAIYGFVIVGDGEFFSRYGCDLCGSKLWGNVVNGSYRLIN